METTTRPDFSITVCNGGLTVAQGERRALGGTWDQLIGTLHSLTGTSWWSPHTWTGDYRTAARWEAASCIAIDLDFHGTWEAKTDKGGRATFKPRHEAPTWEAKDRLERALLELTETFDPGDGLDRGAVLAHHTPRGARLVLMLAEPITDRDLFVRAAAGADMLVSRWLESAGLLGVAEGVQPPEGVRHGDPLPRPGYEVDHKAAIDLARVLWGPRSLAKDPATGQTTQRAATVRGAGDVDRRFDARWLAAFAPQTTIAPKTTEAPPAPPLSSWGVLEAALSKTAHARVTDKGVTVCCPMHLDSSPSAIVFRSGILSCRSSGCPANTSALPLEKWAWTDGGKALVGDGLARTLTAAVPNAPVTNLGDYWHTVSEWQNLDGASWFDEPPPSREWLLTVPERPEYPMRRVLPRGVVGMLAAGGSVGKTMALTQLAVAVATGKRWLPCDGGSRDDFPGFETPEAGGRVLLALGEEDAGEARRRLHSAVMGTGLTADEKAQCAERIVVLPLMGVGVQLIAPADKWGEKPPQPTAFALELRARLMESPEPWALVIIDPLSRWAGPDTETDNAAATKFVQLLETFTDAPGRPTVLVAHHTTKGAKREGATDDTAARGASALSDGVRWHALMTAKAHPEGAAGVGVPRMAELRVVKTNYGVPLDETLWLARDEGGWLRAAKRIEKAAFVEAAQGESGKGAPQRKAKDDSEAKRLERLSR